MLRGASALIQLGKFVGVISAISHSEAQHCAEGPTSTFPQPDFAPAAGIHLYIEMPYLASRVTYCTNRLETTIVIMVARWCIVLFT